MTNERQPADGLFRLDGRRAVVTGGSRGIGRAVALLLAQRGADVAVLAREPGPLQAVLADLGRAGAKAHALAVDLAQPAAAEDGIRQAADLLGGVDVLVNNAGGWGTQPGAVGPLLEVTHDGFDHVVDLNLRSALFGTVAAARIMIEQGAGGAVCTTASIDGLFPAPGEALYGAAKAAVLSLTASLAYELGEHRIRVNAVAPAVIDTELTAPWLATAELRADRASMYPLGRVGRPAEVATAVLFLCSDEAGWISGVTLPMHGGQQATGDAFRWVRAHNPVPAGHRI